MDTNLEIKIKAKTEGLSNIKQMEDQLAALGKIDAFRKLKKDVEGSKAAWQAATAEAGRLAKEMQAADSPTKRLTNSFKKAKKQAAALKAEFLKNQQSLALMRSDLKKAGIDTSKLSAEQNKLKSALAGARSEASKAAKITSAMKMLDTRPFKEIRGEISRLKQAYITLKKSGKLSTAELYRAELQLKAKTAQLKEETNGWARSISRAKAGLASLAAVGYTAVKSFTGYSEFSQKMAEVNTLLDVSKDKFAAYSQQILDMSTKVPQTASELASAEYDIISAGVKLEDSTRVLELSAKAAIAGVTNTKTAVNVGMGVINAYGMSISSLSHVYDVLFETVKRGVTTFPELAESIGDVLPTARSAGVDFETVTAAIATMTKAGIKTPRAVTALKGAINSLAAPTAEAKKQMNALGITWKGFIPTLEEIKKKGLSIDQMRMLIPDVEARTGVLALTQSLIGFQKAVYGAKDAANGMQDAYNKMENTPTKRLELFENEIGKLGIEIGGFISRFLIPAVHYLGEFMSAINKTDTATQYFIGGLAGAGTGFLLWQMGLGKIIFGLRGMGLQALESAADLKALAVAGETTAGVLARIGAAMGAAYGVYEIAKLVKAMYEARKASNQAAQAQDNLYATSDRLMKKFAEFKGLKLTDDILGRAPEEIEAFRRKLLKTKAYWTAFQSKLFQKAHQTTFFGHATKEAIIAGKQLKKVNQRLNIINADLKKLKQAGDKAAKGMEAPAKAVYATDAQLDNFVKQAKKAYQTASAEARKYAQQVIAWEEKIKYARMSTQDKIRELSRKGLTEEQQWNDKKLEAEQKLSAAKQALANKDYKLAEKLAKDSESLYADLATKVQGKENGKDVVVKSLEDTKKIAINGVQAVGDFIDKLYTEQKDNAENSQKAWQKTANAINAELDKIAQDRQANIHIKLKDVKAAANTINNLTKDETKHIKIKVTKEVSTIEKKQAGGIAGYPVRASTGAFIRRAGSLPGFGGGDKIRALLEAGEYIVRKEAVSKYGISFFDAVNAMRLKLPAIKARVGGLISNLSLPEIPQVRAAGFASGGQVSSPETLVIRFQAGDVEAPVKITDPDSRLAMKKFADEMARMRLSYVK